MKSATNHVHPDSERPALHTSDERERLRWLAWLLDSSIPLPGGYKVGLDGLIGLIPGFGDAVGTLISAYIVNEARRLGAPASVLYRMIGNVLLESLIGVVPVLGDWFDFAFKANTRNIALLERYYQNPVRTRRQSRTTVAGGLLLVVLAVAAFIAIPVLVIVGLVRLFN